MQIPLQKLPRPIRGVCPQLVKALMLIFPLGFLPTANAGDNLPADLPAPLNITTTASPRPDTLTPSREINAAAPAPEAMRFISLGRVTFVGSKWDLTDADKRTLDAISDYLAANPGAARVLLDGQTDWVGGIRYNDRLSDKRAMAVQAYLLAKGINPKLIHWKGHGKRTPIDENWTRLGRDRNRQVELFAVYPPHP